MERGCHPGVWGHQCCEDKVCLTRSLQKRACSICSSSSTLLSMTGTWDLMVGGMLSGKGEVYMKKEKTAYHITVLQKWLLQKCLNPMNSHTHTLSIVSLLWLNETRDILQ